MRQCRYMHAAMPLYERGNAAEICDNAATHKRFATLPLSTNDLRQCRCAQTSCGNAAVHKRIAAMPLNTHELRQCRASHDCGNAALHKRFAAMPLSINDLRQCRASHDCGNAARDMVAAMPLIFFSDNQRTSSGNASQASARAGRTHGAKSRALPTLPSVKRLVRVPLPNA